MSESALIITDGDVENVPDERRSQPSSILEFLTTLTGAELTSLYRDPFTTMTVFRALPALARHVILRYLLLVNAAVPQSEAVRVLQSAVVSPLGGPALRRRLTDLNILQRRRTVPFAAVFAASSAQSEEPHVVLNPEFQQCLITALCGSGSGSGSASALVRSAISDGAPMTDLPTEQVPAEPLAPSSTPASASAPALTLSFASTSSAPSKPKSGSSILTLSLAPAPAASTATAPASVSTASGHAPDAAVESSSSAVAVHAAALPASTSNGLPAVTIPMLDAHADATWARLQLWLAGVGPAHQAPPAPVRSRLREMGLVAPQRRGPAAEAELMARLGGIADALRDKDLVVTPAGVAFLFKPRAAQVWSVVLAYMAAQQEQSERETAASAAAGSSSAGAGAGVVAAARDELLRLIFRLCFLEVGEEYSVSELTQGQRRVLRDLRDLGLIYQPSELSETFWPTRLATLLAGPTVGAGKSKAGGAVRAAAAAALREGGSATAAAAREAAAAVVAQLGASRGAGAGASGSASASPGTGDETGSKGGSGDGGEAEDDGFIIVETSFKVVAFTRSPLRLALLSIFVDLSFLLPNAAVGRVTRASVRRALLNGLTVADVAAWFARHAHPQVVRRALGAPDETGRLTGGTGVVVPDNVVKQMGLWADERARLTATDAALVSDFASSEEFSSWAAFCRSAGILLLEEWSTRTLVVTAKGLEKVKEEHARRAKMETAKSMAHTDAGSVGSHVA